MKSLQSTHILARIIEAKRQRLQMAKMRVPEPIVKRMAETAKSVPSFRAALENGRRLRIIAEVKKLHRLKECSKRTWILENRQPPMQKRERQRYRL